MNDMITLAVRDAEPPSMVRPPASRPTPRHARFRWLIVLLLVVVAAGGATAAWVSVARNGAVEYVTAPATRGTVTATGTPRSNRCAAVRVSQTSFKG
jgi:hypothetical protein